MKLINIIKSLKPNLNLDKNEYKICELLYNISK